MNIVYGILNKITNKYYVGSTTKSLNERKLQHCRALKNNKHHSKKLQRSWNKYSPEVFEFLMLEDVEDYDFLEKREQYWIDFLDAYKNGYNGRPDALKSSVGEKNGMFGKPSPSRGKPSPSRRPVVSYCIQTGQVEHFNYVSEVTKKYPHIGPQFLACIKVGQVKCSHIRFHNRFWFYLEDFDLQQLKNRFIQLNAPHPLIGRKRSKIERENISKGRIGMKFSESHCRNMSICRIGKKNKKVIRNDGIIFDSVQEAAKAIGLKWYTSLSHHLNGKTKKCMGFTFKYLEEN